jgi:hypothetical protein
VTRKSSAVKVAERIAGKFLERIGQRPTLLTAKMSPEALNAMLHEQTQKNGNASAAIAVSEMVTFLGKEKYVNAMPGLLTDLYDCPEFRQSVGTVSRGRLELRNVFVSLLSASTPSWLVQSVNPNVVEGGFTSRCLFICANRRKRIVAWPDETENKDEELVEMLHTIYKKSIQFPHITLNENALKKFKHWYRHRDESRDAYRASFESREDGHVLKVAGLLSANRGAWLINKDDIENGIKAIAIVKKHGAELFDGVVGVDEIEKSIDKIRAILCAGGGHGVFERELVRGAQHTASAAIVRSILTLMHELDLVSVSEVQSGKVGKKLRVYSARKELVTRTAYEQIVSRFRVGS